MLVVALGLDGPSLRGLRPVAVERGFTSLVGGGVGNGTNVGRGVVDTYAHVSRVGACVGVRTCTVYVC